MAISNTSSGLSALLKSYIDNWVLQVLRQKEVICNSPRWLGKSDRIAFVHTSQVMKEAEGY